jgi:ribonuclease P/MRP protein subunit RPP40
VLYINDLPEVAREGTLTYLFADDTKTFREVHSQDDCELLQADLYKMQKWADEWLLCFHPEKCKVMRIGRSSCDKYEYRLKEGGNHLEYSEFEKDIGVTIDDKLNFERHICEKVSKANSIMGLIRRTMEYMDDKTFKLLYTALVRPHIEYANQIWSPYLVKHIEQIENVQRRATKQIPGMADLSYMDRLRRLKLPTLSYRRVRGDMIELFKILTGKYDPEVSSFIQVAGDTTTRGHNLKLYKRRARLNIRKNSFVFRSVDLWNSLPSSVVTAKTVVTFESRLDRHWKNQDIYYEYREHIETYTPSDRSDHCDPNISLDNCLELTEEES